MQKYTRRRSTLEMHTQTTPSTCIRNIGFMFDCGIPMQRQDSAICKYSGLQSRNIREIMKSLTPRAVEQITRLFIASRLDGFNVTAVWH